MAMGIMENILRVHISPLGARAIAQDFASIGVDTPSKMRNLILRKSFGLIGIEMLCVVLNTAAAVGIMTIFKLPELQAVSNVALKGFVEVLLFGAGGVFTIEALAHFLILSSFVLSSIFFGTTNLEGFVEATRHLASSPGGRTSTVPTTFPGVTGAREAAASFALVKKLVNLRAAVEKEVDNLPSTSNMDSMQRLAALFELTRAEEEDAFDPEAYDMDKEQATRVAALFAKYDMDSDGCISPEEFGALLKARRIFYRPFFNPAVSIP